MNSLYHDFALIATLFPRKRENVSFRGRPRRPKKRARRVRERRVEVANERRPHGRFLSVFYLRVRERGGGMHEKTDSRTGENRAAGAGYVSAAGQGKICKGRGAVKRPDVSAATEKAAGKDMQRGPSGKFDATVEGVVFRGASPLVSNLPDGFGGGTVKRERRPARGGALFGCGTRIRT